MKVSNGFTLPETGNGRDDRERFAKSSSGSRPEAISSFPELSFDPRDSNRLQIGVTAEACVGAVQELCALAFEHGMTVAEGSGGRVQGGGSFTFVVDGERKQLAALRRDLKAVQDKWRNGCGLPRDPDGAVPCDRFETPEITSPVTLVFEMLPDKYGWFRMKIVSTAEDRVGALHDLCKRVFHHGATFLEGFGGQVHEHGGFFLIVGAKRRDQLEALQRDLESAREEEVAGPCIRRAETFDLEIQAEDRVGLLHDFTRIFKEHDINLVTLASMRFGEKNPPRTAMEIRIDVPRERLGQLGTVFGKLVQMSDEGGFEVRRWTVEGALGFAGGTDASHHERAAKASFGGEF